MQVTPKFMCFHQIWKKKLICFSLSLSDNRGGNGHTGVCLAVCGFPPLLLL